MKLKELEKRLKHEPSNLGLRVQVAGMLREMGRSVEAVEHYRLVALAYRDQGRTQQAIMVCRNILEIAPEDAACQGLLAMLQGRSSPSMPSLPTPAPGELKQERVGNPRVVTTAPISVPSMPSISTNEPPQRSSMSDETPLPKPMPYHEFDRTSQPSKVSAHQIEQKTTQPTGLATAARHISGLFTSGSSPGIPNREMDLSAELDTRQRPKVRSEELRKITESEATYLEERATPPRSYGDEDLPTDQLEGFMTPPPRASEEAMTPPPVQTAPSTQSITLRRLPPTPPSPPTTESITLRRLPPMPKPAPGSKVTIPPRRDTRDTYRDSPPPDTQREPLRREPKSTHIGPPTRDTHRDPSARDPRDPHRGPPRPPPRSAMPKIPTTRDSEEMTVPHQKSSLGDDDDDDDTEV